MLTETRPTVAFDPLDQAWRFNDRPIYDKIRKAGGIAWSPEHGGFWATPDIELAKQILSSKNFISGKGVRIPPSGTLPVFALEYDDPAHNTHRKVLAEAVGPRIVPTFEAGIRTHARRLLAEMAGDVLDLGEQYAFRLPVDVLFEVIGGPDRLKDEVEEIAGALFIYRTPLPDGRSAVQRLNEIIAEMVTDCIENQRSDWLTSLVTRRCPHSESLTDIEVQGAILTMLTGGHHTTVRVGSSLIAQIVGNQDLQEKLRSEPKALPDAINEAVRLYVPLGWFARHCIKDTEVGGITIKEGERVMIMYAGACRDPKVFENPDEFMLNRPTRNNHVGFGWGVHRCAGMQLAQLELKVAIEEIFAASKWVSLREPITWTSSSEARHIHCTFQH